MSVRYLFNSAGNYVAFQQGSNVFSPDATWLGFIKSGNLLYATDGKFLGYILGDDRVARNKNEPPHTAIPATQRPLRPFKPLKPLKPLKRLKQPRLPYPYEDVFEHGVVGQELVNSSVDLELDSLLGSSLYAGDNTLLGNVNKNPYDTDSINNPYGNYGNPYSAQSIFNEFAKYGNPFSPLSPYNEFTRTPPRFVKNGQVVAYLTVNKFISPRVEPDMFKAWLSN